MRKKILNISLSLLVFAVLAMVATSCVKQIDRSGGGLLPSDEVFDFSTKTKSMLKVKYDVPVGYKVYFEVFSQLPIEINTDGQMVKKSIKPVDVGFTDGNGAYYQNISIPSTVNKLYIYSTYAGVPNLMIADVIRNGITEAKLLVEEEEGPKSFLASKAYDHKTEYYNVIDGPDKRLGYWMNFSGYFINGVKRPPSYRVFGRPDYLLYDRVDLTAELLTLINETVPEEGGTDARLIKSGDIHIAQEAEIDVHLLDETTASHNTIAYYCYPTATPPTNRSEIKDLVILFADAKVFKSQTAGTIKGNYGSLERGEGVKLNYWKDGVNMGKVFPANTSIGWVIYCNAYEACIVGINSLKTRDAKALYANKMLNESYGSKEQSVLFRSGDDVVLALEDWDKGTYDYNDVILQIKSNPSSAITKDIINISPEEPNDDEVSAEVTYNGVLAFEDLWPSRGDFDMNDFVVKYESAIGYNTKNEVVQTADKFTIMHIGSSFDNSFAYQLSSNSDDVEISFKSSLGGNGGAYLDSQLDKATVRLINNSQSYANLTKKPVFEVTTKYKNKIVKGQFAKPPYNPFITTHRSDIEVHLTNMIPSASMDQALLGAGDDKSEPNKGKYYITYDHKNIQMPFAIDMTFEDSQSADAFVVPKEGKRIDQFYPKFLNWVKTSGNKDADWYLHPIE